jgi:hypothetical protein
MTSLRNAAAGRSQNISTHCAENKQMENWCLKEPAKG